MPLLNPAAPPLPGFFAGTQSPQIYNSTPAGTISPAPPQPALPFPIVRLGTKFLSLIAELDPNTRVGDIIIFAINAVPSGGAILATSPPVTFSASYLSRRASDPVVYHFEEFFYPFTIPGIFDVDYTITDPTQTFNFFSPPRRFIVQ